MDLTEANKAYKTGGRSGWGGGRFKSIRLVGGPMRVQVGEWVKWILCLVLRHIVYPTGRELIVLYQVRCHRCGSLFLCNESDPRDMLPWNNEVENFFIDCEHDKDIISFDPRGRRE